MNKWEYFTLEIQPIVKNQLLKSVNWDAGYISYQLNQYGALGWELISCYTVDGSSYQGNGGGTIKILATLKREVTT